MLRLWPERLVASIFTDAGHLYRVGGKELARWSLDVPAQLGVGDGLDRLIDLHRPRPGATLELIVSDSAARLIPLPWQDKLSNEQQRESYARACFGHAGFQIDEDWVVQAAYRHFRGMGLGLALPRPIVLEARDHLATHGVRLRSIMPVSAWAYWRIGAARGQRTVLLLRERSRVSAMLFNEATCAGLHVQPIGMGLADAVRRLQSTIDPVFPSVSRVRLWSAVEDDAQQRAIENLFPAARFDMLSQLEGM